MTRVEMQMSGGKDYSKNDAEIAGFLEALHLGFFFNLTAYNGINSRWVEELSMKNEITKELKGNHCFYNFEVGKGLSERDPNGGNYLGEGLYKETKKLHCGTK